MRRSAGYRSSLLSSPHLYIGPPLYFGHQYVMVQAQVDDQGFVGQGSYAQRFKVIVMLAAVTPEMTVTGKVISGGDQIAGRISQINHVHGGVQPGGGNTGKPH